MGDSRKVEDIPTPFEEALTKTGNGLYNVLLASTCALILLAIGIELFGFTLVVTVACDLELTVAQKGILTSLPFIGILLVSYIWGYVSDTRGRRYTLMISLQVGFFLSVISSLSYNWLLLGLLKFLSVCFSCAANSATYTLVGESCVQRVRSKYMVMMTCFILLSPAVAGILTYPTLKLDFAVELTWLGVVFRPWRLLIIVLALPTGMGAVAIYFFYESPKFLANWGRKGEALEVLRSMYAVNFKCPKDEYKVHSLVLQEESEKRKMSLFRGMFKQSAPLFRRPLLGKTVQLFYVVAVVYITNNSFLVWLPHILNLVRISLESERTVPGNICSLISSDHVKLNENTADNVYFENSTAAINTTSISIITPEICLGRVEDNVIITLIASQFIFAFLNFAISYLPDHRKKILITILCMSSLSGVCLNLMPEPISSVFFFVGFTCTCLGMGILASYFVDLYPTSCRGMAACLSIMVGRSSAFIGINIVANLIFQHCQITFYLWALLVLSSVVAASFLPPDKPSSKITAL